MFEAPFTAVREDGKFHQQFDFISDVARMLLRHEHSKTRWIKWLVYDRNGTLVPEYMIKECLP